MPELIIQKALRPTKRQTLDTGPGLTEQSHKDQCDMNVILRNYQRTGLITHAKENQGRYDDISPIDFQEAMFIVTNAQKMFNELPSGTRKEFGNSPKAFLEFTQNPANQDRMQAMGMLKGNDGLNRHNQPINSPQTPPPEAAPTPPPQAPK